MSVDYGDARRAELAAGAQRRSGRRQVVVARMLAVGGAACCIALGAEFGVPVAEALSILLPAGNGNATQIDILEGNVIDPQFGLGGNGNSSENSAVGNLLLGLGNNSATGTSGSGPLGVIALGGAQGSGNVTQLSILSYNVINPQFSLDGSNLSHNTAVTNVAANNGNHSANEANSAGGAGVGLFGAALGNGNTTQYALFSGNIFNPQMSLFGDNMSTNTAITNVSMDNGNWSQNAISGSGIGTAFFGAATGNGNTTQYGGFVSNIYNPQFSLLGTNNSHNEATTNVAEGNGNHSTNEVGSGGLGLNTLVGGANGNGNSDQTVSSSGNINNDQFALGNQIMLPGMQTPMELPGTAALKTGAQQTNAAIAGVIDPLSKLAAQGNTTVTRIKDAVTNVVKHHPPAAEHSSQPDANTPSDSDDSDG